MSVQVENLLSISGAVAIGRNEGVRLERCLESLVKSYSRVVYVDSGSTDGSVAFAQKLGVQVVALNMAQPFTAARARNEGVAALLQVWPDTEFVHFIDGDCEMIHNWPEMAVAVMQEDETLGIVTGWTVERHREASVYNLMCDIEWHQPAGDIQACGGIFFCRISAFQAVEGFNPIIIAAEDDEFCVRIRKQGWRLRRLPFDMALHDAAITSFSQWWQRAIRAGHGYAQVGSIHKDYFVASRRRTWFWGAIVPILIGIGLVVHPLIGILFAGLYPLSYIRTRQNLIKSELSRQDATLYARFLTIAKFANMQGILRYWRRRLLKQDIRLIEYK